MKVTGSSLVVLLFASFLFPAAEAFNGWSGKTSSPGLNMNRLLGKSVCSAVVAVVVSSGNAVASSGGGLDYANANLKEQGNFFVGGKFEKKDFTQCDASGISFKGAKLTGSRFFKAKLFNTDFTDADLTNASIEDDGLEGAVFDNAVLVGSYLSKEIVDAKSILNADFTDAQMPDYTRKALCKRTDISGKNPKTDVAITGIDGQSRTSDDLPDRPLRVRHEQKKAKYGPTEDRYNLQFVPAVFSHTGQMHAPFKSFVMEQIRHKLITFEGKAKSSRVKAVMKWWTKCISMVIAKTASRNVAFKSDKIMDALFQGQSAEQTPQPFDDADFEGLTSNAEVYIFNQDDSQE